MRLRLRTVGLLTIVSSLIFALVTPVSAEAPENRTQGEVDSVSVASRTTTANMERPPWTNTPCPEMTDSITRLYTAFFERQPEQGGFEFWIEEYSSGRWNLDRMARQFVVSDEFVETYGSLTNEEFVDLIYQNIQGRPGEPTGRAFWIDELNSGRMTRGRVMIFFSESEEYVTRSQTVRPMAGYLGWYPEGTSWACANGAGAMELAPGENYADILVTNFERTDQRYTIVSYDRDFADPIVIDDNTLPVGFYSYYKADRFLAGDGYLEFDMTDNMYWLVVNYPTPMVDLRDGWES